MQCGEAAAEDEDPRRHRHSPSLERALERPDIVAGIAGISDLARVVLAGVRLVNGTAALVAPATFARRLGADPETSPAALYALRLFGVRTVLIGADLLRRDPAARARALRAAPLIHLSDLAAAAIAGAQQQLSPKAARTATIVSGANVALALLARRRASL